MNELMDDIYYMVTERIDQQSMQNREMKLLMARKCALADEIVFRLGENGENLLEALTELDSEMEAIRDKALFHEALHLGTQISFN